MRVANVVVGCLSGFVVDRESPKCVSFLVLVDDAGLRCFEDSASGKVPVHRGGFREKFRSVRPVADESFQSFYTRIVHLCNRWIDLSKTGRTFDGLMDLMLQEQILQSFSKETVVFLRERKFQSVEELVEAGERYRVAHPGKPLARKSVSNLWSESASDNECFATVAWRHSNFYRGYSQGNRRGSS